MGKLRPSYQRASEVENQTSDRERWLFLFFIVMFAALFARYFYLQIIKGQEYELKSQEQHQQKVTVSGARGKIYSSDGYLLVGNHQIYRLYAVASQVESPVNWYETVAPIILADSEASATLKPLTEIAPNIELKRGTKGVVVIANKVSQDTKEKLTATGLTGLQFEAQNIRYYPEGEMASQTIGFLSKDTGDGHYGIEGGLNKELAGKTTQTVMDVDVSNNPIYFNAEILNQNLDGRDIYLTIRRDIQVLIEDELAKAMAKYGATRGEIIIMEPATGKILGLATAPTYDPNHYNEYQTDLYKNPAVVDLYEPGSTFKVLTVAAGIETGVISPETTCTKCYGPRQIADATIKTWDEHYNGAITMTEALEKSDNTAMVYIANDLLGGARLREYLTKFGIGTALNLETEEDVPNNFPTVWGPVEIATRSFGQGISVTSLQLMRAVGAIANNGKMMQPYLVEKAVDPATGETYVTEPTVLAQVVSPNTAATVSKMMQAAAAHGEAQYVYKNTTQYAGKTGTASIPTSGGYEEDATIASFIGFAPYEEPKFLMMVKFERPQSSPWAAETAAPTWKEIAEKLSVIFNIQAD